MNYAILMSQTCIIIESNYSHNEMLQTLAKGIGFKTISFLTAEEFLKEELFNFSCFIFNWNLPGIDGIELLQEIRKFNPIATIFLITGYADARDHQNALDAGADEYFVKPYISGHLTAKLKTVFKKHSALMSLDLSRGVKFIEQTSSVIINGEFVALSPSEYQLANLLYTSKHQHISRENIVKTLNMPTEGKTIEVHIHTLRKKITHKGVSILNRKGRGYLWA